MKSNQLLQLIVLVFFLSACNSGQSETVSIAESALADLQEGRSLLASVQSEKDAEAIEQDIQTLANSYSNAIKALNSDEAKTPDVAQKLAQITPKIASEYQGLILELNSLQSRNPKAAQILLDELKGFKS
ncbi:hypothetical protein DRW07_04345 [Alteromonas sediminis]|uniref:Uncharacterized protein n=1 Tax=Alteromonas sediminis TaxID=2259342 RepID=A0A3N5ZE89_9ALTE|nr:hypothetical protein [Alteromonas sediminis]RPJ68638.1 hypothetical protein DRW07_04345 [Alteromonas sediminis]